MLISTFGMSRKKALVVSFVILLCSVAVAVGTYYYLDSKNNDEFVEEAPAEIIDEGEALTPEYTEKVTNFETDTVEVILNKDISEIEKVIELTNAASLSISVGNFAKALPYQEAAYNLNVGEQGARDQLTYEIILSSRELGDQARLKQYEEILGQEKLNNFDTPRNREDERE